MTLGYQAPHVNYQGISPVFGQAPSVSFQDRLNSNTADFKSLLRQPGISNNAGAISLLQGQKFQQDSQVMGEQYRTNQMLQTDMDQQNRNMLFQTNAMNNQTALNINMNNAAADDKTKMTRLRALDSIGNKIAMNKRDNNMIRMAEGFSEGWGWNPSTGKFERNGPQDKVFAPTVPGVNPQTSSTNNPPILDEGDTFIQNYDGTWTIKKKQSEYGARLAKKKLVESFRFGGKVRKF